MLEIRLQPFEWFDEEKDEFILEPEITVSMEHSLLSVSRWESKHKKAFLSLLDSGGLTSEELLEYFGLMIIDPPVSNTRSILARLSQENIQAILKYLEDSQTATIVNDREPNKPARRLITSELIYTWMLGLGIEKAYEEWNVNRLLTLIRVASIELNPEGSKMSSKEAARMQRNINELNRKKLKTRG